MGERLKTLFLCVTLTGVIAFAVTDEAVAKKGKIHVCVAKRGPDKGAMRFVRGKKCQKGEKSLSWNKKGMPGPAGATGQTGPAGAGEGAQQTIDQLRTQLDQQSTRVADLESQVAQLTTQYSAALNQLGALGTQVTGLGNQFGAFQTTACGQLTNLTDQSNDLGTAIDGIDVTGLFGGLAFISPGAPTALQSFAC
jgi:hypothetical protein